MNDVRECPKCGAIDNSIVIDSRKNPDGAIRRRLKCLSCDGRYTTFEITSDYYNNLKVSPLNPDKSEERKRLLEANMKTIEGLMELQPIVQRLIDTLQKVGD